MEAKRYQKGDVIFREMTLGNTMYEIKNGTVGIYVGYGKPEEKKLTELGPGRIFGEMAVIEVYPRSATAVALENVETEEISATDLQEYFKGDPDRLMEIMRGLSRRLRELTADYDEACDALGKWTEETKRGSKLGSAILGALRKFANAYAEGVKHTDPYMAGFPHYCFY